MNSHNATVSASENGLELHSRRRGPLTEGGRQRLLVRAPDRVSEPFHLNRIELANQDNDCALFRFRDEQGIFFAELEISSNRVGFQFGLHVESESPIWMAEWTLANLDLSELIIPALGGQAIDETMPSGESLAFKYPFWWNAQFAIGMSSAGGGGMMLRTEDVDPILKMLRVTRTDAGLFDVTLGIESDAREMDDPLEGIWHIEVFDGNWREPVERHRSWMKKAFGLVEAELHPHFPTWADEVTMILEIWGMRKDTGEASHTFGQMEERIDQFAMLYPPEQTLVYLPGFAENGIDSHIPDYNPSPRLGGPKGFRRLVDHAHRLGYRVMIHTNVLGMAYSHPLFPEFEQHQVVDVFGRPQGWAMDVDGDWLPEPFFAYMNPGSEAWSDLMAGILGKLIDEFELDAVFLDQTLLAFNVLKGSNFLTGMREHVSRLQKAHPSILFAGEGLNDFIQPVLPMAQIHGIDSVVGVHGLEGRHLYRRVHPVSAALFGPYTRLTAHLLTKHPSNPVFEQQEAAYEALSVLPALVLYDHLQPLETPGTTRMLQRAQQLAERRVHRLEASRNASSQ